MIVRTVPLLRAALLAGYVALAWAGAFGAPPILETFAIGCLGTAVLLPALLRVQSMALFAWLILVLMLALVGHSEYARLPGYLVPPLVLGIFAAVFGRTLLPNTTPLVARFVCALDGAEFAARPKVTQYARRVTLGWTLLLTALALATLMLALCVRPDGVLAALGADAPFAVSPKTWSVATAGGGYGITVLAFALEFILRRIVLPEAPRHRFSEFARRVAELWSAELRKP